MTNLTKYLEDIRKRSEAATPGPWIYNSSRDTHDSCIYPKNAKEAYGYIDEAEGVVGSSEWIWIKDNNANFIAHARTDVDVLREMVDCLLNHASEYYEADTFIAVIRDTAKILEKHNEDT